jgi:hypothetical protein
MKDALFSMPLILLDFEEKGIYASYTPMGDKSDRLLGAAIVFGDANPAMATVLWA